MSDNWFYDGFINEVKNIARPGSGGSVPKPLTYDYMPEGYPSKSGWSIEWDGNTEGLVSVVSRNFQLYKVSDMVPTDDEFIGRETLISNGARIIIGSENIGAFSQELTIIGAGEPFAVVVKKDNANFEGVQFTAKGIYMLKVGDVYVQKITDVVKTMAEEFIPNIPAEKLPTIPEENISSSFPRVSTANVGQIIKVTDIDENGKPVAWEASDIPENSVFTVHCVGSRLDVSVSDISSALDDGKLVVVIATRYIGDTFTQTFLCTEKKYDGTLVFNYLDAEERCIFYVTLSSTQNEFRWQDQQIRYPLLTSTLPPSSGQGVVLPSTTKNSTKKFKITVDDTGTLSATEVT